METPQPPPRRRLPLVALGGAAAMVAGLGIAWALVGRSDPPQAAPPASEGGLVIDSSAADDGRIDPAKPLRCFVQGRMVGELTLAECAKRNGVATDALDVGIDQTGSLAAADQAGQALTPLPPDEGQVVSLDDQLAGQIDPAEATAAPTDGAAPGGRPLGACLRYAGARWRRVAGDGDLDACVQTLFAGRCERVGGASYGRWGQQTLRLVAGRVEISDDNKTFRLLTVQSGDCAIDRLG